MVKNKQTKNVPEEVTLAKYSHERNSYSYFVDIESAKDEVLEANADLERGMKTCWGIK